MAFFSGNKQADDSEDTAKNVFHFEYYKKNVLVTGSNGQLGSELKRLSAEDNPIFQFLFTDVDSLDITDISSLENFVKENGVKYIINCAAYTAVDRAEDDAGLCYKINRDAVRNIGIVANKHSVKVIHVSTDYVFNGTKNTPYQETDATSPDSVYGKSKAEGEEALINCCPQSVIIRTAWLYSIYGNNFVKTMIRLGEEKSELNVVADQRGTPTNAFDLARTILQVLNFSETNSFIAGIYHYTDLGETTWYDFTLEIHRLYGIKSCKVNPITTDQYPTKAKRPQYSILDKTKIINTFNLEIPFWQNSLERCIKELKELQ
ncbi:MAG: dTDP-4-dehydrorhamnose reductase [Dysgonomonas sp.]